MSTISIDPITRIEGHLGIGIEVKENRVTSANCKGEMFRGFETILRGRDPMDAQHITQRICGVCPVSHGMASVLAQDDAYGNTVPDNGRLVRNLILGANYIQSHILHFYHLAALDFVDIVAITRYTGGNPFLLAVKGWVDSEIASGALHPAAPFLPRYEGKYLDDDTANIIAIKHYLDGLDMRTLAHKMGALFSGKLPHAMTLTPGGVTEKVTANKIAAYRAMLSKLTDFINTAYLEDVVAVAGAFPEYFSTGGGYGNFLSYGVFRESSNRNDTLFPAGVIIDGKLQTFDPGKIAEDIRYSHFASGSGLHPSRGETVPKVGKPEAYTWLKAPRYAGKPLEVGPLARMMVAYLSGHRQAKPLIDSVLSRLGAGPEVLISVLGRHAARAIECKLVADRCAEWIEMIEPGKPTYADFKIPRDCRGMGLTEAPRGALGHWISVKDYKIETYQCIVPTTWNCSPRDDAGQPGPVEQALVGTTIADEHHPIEAARVVRSFDPCLACAIH